ncbi:hypothetical protein [Candidatus Uabimicrobium sp. HlEnr_7]|uniref:hypothetical protein n=1 Tax=Candidatus Uabimicrobium helgolandensis TaxID=3095367 RepID=UPI0035584551
MKIAYWCIGITLFLCGCQSHGSLYISHPQVFTRERLVNTRIRENQWLKDQLEKKPQSTFQGLSEVRNFEGFFNRLNTTYKPLAGEVNDIQKKNQSQQLQRQNEIARLQHQIQVKELQEQLNNKASANPKPQSNLVPPISNTAPSKQQSEFKSSQTLPKEQIAETKAQISSLDRLHDHMAYRDAVNAIIREKQLDDTHDLRGFTLYTLKFDLTLLPGKKSSRYAMATVQLSSSPPISKDQDFQELYGKWLNSLKDDINKEITILQRRLVTGHIEPGDLRHIIFDQQQKEDRIIIGLQQELTKQKTLSLNSEERKLYKRYVPPSAKMPGTTRSQVKKLIYNWEQTHHHILDLINDPKQWKQILNHRSHRKFFMEAAVTHVVSKYQNYFYDTVNIRTQPLEFKGTTNFVVEVFAHQKGLANFKKHIKHLRTHSLDPYVAGVEPKEHAQNISEVSSKENLLNLLFSLEAALPQGMNFDESLEYIRKSQTLVNAIKRRPLVIGFGQGTKKFGWILGPKFSLNNGEVIFLHTPIRHTFTASIVVPAWQSSISLTGVSHWIDEQGKKKDSTSLWQQQQIEVVLPGDMSSLTNALISLHHKSRPRPMVLPPLDSKQMVLKAFSNKTQHLLIRGHELWRNPEVFVGTHKAHRIDVLPDMEGLYAYFNDIEIPYAQSEETTVDLTVITSLGSSRLRNAVTIIPARRDVQVRPFANIIPTLVGTSPRLSLAVAPATVPQGYHSFHCHLRTNNDKISFLLRNPGSLKNRNFLNFTLTSKDKFPKTPQLYEVDVRIKMHSEDIEHSILADPWQQIAFFPSSQDSHPKLLSPTQIQLSNQQTFSLRFDMTNKELFNIAYPGLADSLIRKRAAVTIAQHNVPIVSTLINELTPVVWAAKLQNITTLQKQKLLEANTCQLFFTYFSNKGIESTIPVEGKIIFSK